MLAKDRDDIYAILQDSAVRVPFSLFSEPHFNKNSVTGWCRVAAEVNRGTEGIDRFYVLQDKGRTIGYFGAGSDPDEKDESCWEVGYFLDRRYHGQGIVPHVFSGYIEEARNLSLAKTFCAAVKPDNYPSQRVLEKVGFECKGVFKKWSPIIIHKDGSCEEVTPPRSSPKMKKFELKLF